MRTIVVTGSASGIGASLTGMLRARGERVIGVDLRDAEVLADLSTAEGRAELVAEVSRLAEGRIDAVVANAGTVTPVPRTASLNYFGAVATLEGLRPLLAGSNTPRASATASISSLNPHDEDLVQLLLAGDEAGALERSAVLAASPDPVVWKSIYTSSKRALSIWLRRRAASDDWAGAGIPLNAVAPGVVATPLNADQLATPGEQEDMLRRMPMPLNGIAGPDAPAAVHAMLVSRENTHMCGQVVFVDGGAEVLRRGESTW